MSVYYDELAQLLNNSGWVNISDHLTKCLNQQLIGFRSEYAIVILYFVEDAKAAMDRWIDDQLVVASVRSAMPTHADTDLYLLYLVPFINHEEIAMLQPLLSDRRVARKICVEYERHGIVAAMQDTPLIVTTRGSADHRADDLAEILGPDGALSPDVLRELAKSSPAVIVDRLLSDDYYASTNNLEAP